jgi:hypothetical protein
MIMTSGNPCGLFGGSLARRLGERNEFDTHGDRPCPGLVARKGA